MGRGLILQNPVYVVYEWPLKDKRLAIIHSIWFISTLLKSIFHKKVTKNSQLHEICIILPRVNSTMLHGEISKIGPKLEFSF